MINRRSVLTYTQHCAPVIDITSIENSHSVASASLDGQIHVWRVDVTSNSHASMDVDQSLSNNRSNNDFSSANASPMPPADQQVLPNAAGINNVSGYSAVKVVDPSEGSIQCVQHFNSDICSVVAYATQRGGVHGWDLRASQEAMNLKLRPELGYTTAMTISPDRNWISVGTSKGFIAMWDIRYDVMCNLWQHSSASAIHRLACCRSLSASAANPAYASVGIGHTEGAYLFVATGQNETAVWGLPEAGECLKCFRTVPLDSSRNVVAPLPSLLEINTPRHPHAPIQIPLYSSTWNSANSIDHSVRALLGRVSFSNTSYVVTGGTDKSIR